MILAAMATMPERLELLEKVVAAIRPQVDALRVYLNNFDSTPSFLTKEEGLLSNDALGDLGSEGKFYWFDKAAYDYYLTIDDDLRYPPDYATRLVEEFDKRKSKAVVGVHGFVFSEPIESYIDSRAEKYKCTYALDNPRPVHVIGTATTILTPKVIRLSHRDFPRRNTTDLQVAIAAQRQRVPLIVIPRREGWIQELRDPNSPEAYSIWRETKNEGGVTKAKLAREAVPHWQLYDDPLRN